MQRDRVRRPTDQHAAVATPGLVLQRVRCQRGGQAAVDELRRPAQRLAPCLVFEGGDELLRQAQTWILRKHIGTQVLRNILSAPTRMAPTSVSGASVRPDGRPGLSSLICQHRFPRRGFLHTLLFHAPEFVGRLVSAW
jgi:hypothetical protein